MATVAPLVEPEMPGAEPATAGGDLAAEPVPAA
jgi:hypothetical protein